MTVPDNQAQLLAELADLAADDPAVVTFLAANPDLADELQLARQVRVVVNDLLAEGLQLPAGFEARLLSRVRQEATVNGFTMLGIDALSRTLLELIRLVFGLAPAPRAMPVAG